MFGNSVKFFYANRLFFAAYLSVLIHITLAIWSFNGSKSPYGLTICGPSWIYDTEETRDTELVFEMGTQLDGGKKRDQDGESDQGEEEGEGEKGKNEGFAKGKYEGGQWDKLVKDLESTSDLRKNFKNDLDSIVPSSGISDSYIKRERDYEDIIVKEVFPTLHSIREPFKVDIEEAEDSLAVHKERNRIIEEFRKGEEESPPITMRLSLEGEKPPRSPLQMPKEERSRYLDQSLKQPKEKQLNEFISRFLGYDVNKGDLSTFVRDLYYENLQRLAYTFSNDPTYFAVDYFQENLNKEDFLKQMMALLSEHLGTKTGTEILFTIENIYEIQGRALNVYFQNESLYQTYSEERKKELRVETIRRVVEKYKPILREKKIRSFSDAEAAYTNKRLQIMDSLIQNTPNGYRLQDALFEKGRILWESGILKGDDKLLYEAIGEWKKISKKGEGDFLAEKTVENILLTLQQEEIRDAFGKFPSHTRERIDMAVRYRLADVLEKKKLREEKILWPKTKKQVSN
ncbi:hypothetical protein LPTSP3_g07050 [Leptospira kobayashii]|uniref:Uncharacterized protein n=1 Tax=Leptospira kobayashii TaxID=1917830 RepID=A0ABM7UQP7_9LEPT|nr:hypothetical protein [Leptospira kobayashii]BDA77775.1 hypothetical protein LPTSP3_g07050 [Leptospira kobayashii]